MAQISAVFQRLIRFVLDTVCTVLELFFPNEKGYLPPITDPLLLQPAVSLVQKIKTGQLKSEQVVGAYIKRIKEVQPHINAIVDERFEDALKEAKELDQQIAEQLARNGTLDQSLQSKPMLGIPYTGKDCIAIKGMRFTSGIPARKDIRSELDSTVAILWREAGAIPLAQTNVPELLLWWDTVNKSFGRTNNPYDKSLIPGGSTGGNASLIASAGSLVGVSSDIGGSIRIPANFCGVFGHCCSVETVPLDNQWPPYAESRKKLVSYGPMTRYVCDLRPLVKMYTSRSEEQLNLDEPVDIKDLRVFYLTDFGDPSLTPVEECVRESLRVAAKQLQSLGATVKEAKLSKLKNAFELWMCKMNSGDANPMAFEMTNRNGTLNVYWELVRCLLGQSPHTFVVLCTAIFQSLSAKFSGASREKYLEQHRELKNEIDQLLGKNGVLLLPTHPELAVKPVSCLFKFKNTCYTGVFNTLRVTMTQIPLGLNKSGVPVGIQAIATHLNDHLTLKVAEVLGQEFGGWVPPTTVSTGVN